MPKINRKITVFPAFLVNLHPFFCNFMFLIVFCKRKYKKNPVEKQTFQAAGAPEIKLKIIDFPVFLVGLWSFLVILSF